MNNKSQGSRGTGLSAGVLHERLMAVADRIYQRDRARFSKLLVWFHTSRQNRWSDTRIYQALLALDKREAEGLAVDNWWAWLNAALRKIRTLEIQRENEGFKHGEPNALKTILRKIMKEGL